MKIFLVGLAGAGKTTLGKPLANQLGIRFVDLDEVIERDQEMEIPAIFEQKGETYFRGVESAILRHITRNTPNFVLATGGGAPCHEDNMQLILEGGVAIYLNVPPKNLAERVIKDGIARRPLYKGLDKASVLAKIKTQLQARESYYKQAQIVMAGGDITVEQLFNKIRGVLPYDSN